MKQLVFLLLVGFASGRLSAQQNLGVRNSNYAGIQGALINPSSIADSKMNWDLNIISVDEVFGNTFLYAPKKNLHFLGFKQIIKGALDQDLFGTHFDPQNPYKLYQVSFSGEALGPSFFLKLPKNQAIGFSFRARAYANFNNITGALAQNLFDYFLNKSLWATDLHDNSVKIDEMSWLEYSVHYAAEAYSDAHDEIKAGVSLNYLMGNTGAYAKNANLNYKINDSNFIFTNTSLDYGRTDLNRPTNFGNGNGFGADLGFTWLHFRQDRNKYLYRVGLSLIDLGAIKFKHNAAAYHLEADSADFSNWHQQHFVSNTQFDRAVSAVFYAGDSSKSLVANQFKMGLPSAISVQADWNVCQRYFLNLTVIKGFHHGNGQGVIRPDVYGLTPRYETPDLDVSLPFSLLYYGHMQSRLGIACRYKYFFIGGDAPGPLLKLKDLDGADFYTGVRFYILPKNQK